MFDPNENIDLNSSRATRRPERPEPKPIADPKTQLWLPADLATETREQKPSTKQHIKQIGNFLVPVVGIGFIVAAFGYVAVVLIGVYK